MSDHVRLIIGLGNPGSRYRNTWHNLGFRVVEELAHRWKCQFKVGRGECLAADSPINGGVTLMQPTSFMNRSGTPVGGWMRYFKVDPWQLLVIYDDHDIPLGRIRLREEGSSGGHRGMDDIIQALGTDKIPRIRIGIQTEAEHRNLADQVLSTISPKFTPDVERAVLVTADAAELAVTSGILKAMNRYNGQDLI